MKSATGLSDSQKLGINREEYNKGAQQLSPFVIYEQQLLVSWDLTQQADVFSLFFSTSAFV